MTPWSADVEAFLQHWKSLRRGALLPTSEYLLDHAPVVSMPRCYIAEVSADQTFIRYQGAAVTDFWQRDFTGCDMHAGDRDKYKNRSLGNMKNIVGHPCGQYARFLFNTSFGARLISEYLNLPLAVQSGRPPRIICLVKPEIPNKRTEPFTRTIQSSEQEWVDLSAGVPPAPPQSFV